MKFRMTMEQIPSKSTDTNQPQYKIELKSTGTHYECKKLFKFLKRVLVQVVEI
jgi:hypothetical protein